jgi:hypothetical protein
MTVADTESTRNWTTTGDDTELDDRQLRLIPHDAEGLQIATIADPDACFCGPASIVGRDGELARLRSYLRLAAAAESTAVIISGEAGIDKTVLCHVGKPPPACSVGRKW